MHPTDSIPLVPTVKLFPRLASPHTSSNRRLQRRSTADSPYQPVAENDPEVRRGQVRARLLRMILDNEQVRRNEQRPSAS